MVRLPLAAIAWILLSVSSPAAAHCDALDGPVVRDARQALDTHEIDGVLKWVGPGSESEVRNAFSRVLEARESGDAAREVSDGFFFETVVRLHRAAEGEGFTGLKAEGSVSPAIADADAALARGDVKVLAKRLAHAVEAAIVSRYDDARERRKHQATSVGEGRRYVAAYVDFVHFVEAVHALVEGGAKHGHEQPAGHAAD